jgi:hypothetical protein
MMEGAMDRPNSSTSLEQSFMNRTASALSSWGDQSARAEQLNERLHSALKQNRTRIPAEWFDKQYASIAQRDAAARQQAEVRLEARRVKCQEFATTRRRTMDRLFSEIIPQREMERGQIQRSLHTRMSAADTRLAARAERRSSGISERRARREQDSAERANFFAEVRREQSEREVSFQQVADARPAAARRAWERRLGSVSEKAQRAQQLRDDAQAKRDELQRRRRRHHERLMEKHHGMGEWLQDLDRQKRATLRQVGRRPPPPACAITSCFGRNRFVFHSSCVTALVLVAKNLMMTARAAQGQRCGLVPTKASYRAN